MEAEEGNINEIMHLSLMNLKMQSSLNKKSAFRGYNNTDSYQPIFKLNHESRKTISHRNMKFDCIPKDFNAGLRYKLVMNQKTKTKIGRGNIIICC
jgi:hypothetical protein